MQHVRGMVAHLARPDLVGLLAAGHAHAAADHVDRLLLRMLMRARAVAGAPVHLHHLDRLAAHDWAAGVGMRRGDEVVEVAVKDHARHESSYSHLAAGWTPWFTLGASARRRCCSIAMLVRSRASCNGTADRPSRPNTSPSA